jgi:hypothetical protein
MNISSITLLNPLFQKIQSTVILFGKMDQQRYSPLDCKEPRKREYLLKNFIGFW